MSDVFTRLRSFISPRALNLKSISTLDSLLSASSVFSLPSLSTVLSLTSRISKGKLLSATSSALPSQQSWSWSSSPPARASSPSTCCVSPLASPSTSPFWPLSSGWRSWGWTSVSPWPRLDFHHLCPGFTLSRTLAPAPTVGGDGRKLLLYSLLGWGLPLLLTLALLTLQLSLPADSLYQPGVGSQACLLHTYRITDTILLTVPMTIIQTSNAVIFILLMVYLVRAKLETRHVRLSTRRHQSSESSSDVADQLVLIQTGTVRFTIPFQALYVKIFLVVGVSWLSESFHKLSHKTVLDHQSNIETIFAIFDALNLLRGFFFFLIFICKKNVYTKMRNYLRARNPPNLDQVARRQTQVSEGEGQVK